MIVDEIMKQLPNSKIKYVKKDEDLIIISSSSI